MADIGGLCRRRHCGLADLSLARQPAGWVQVLLNQASNKSLGAASRPNGQISVSSECFSNLAACAMARSLALNLPQACPCSGQQDKQDEGKLWPDIHACRTTHCTCRMASPLNCPANLCAPTRCMPIRIECASVAGSQNITKQQSPHLQRCPLLLLHQGDCIVHQVPDDLIHIAPMEPHLSELCGFHLDRDG